MKDSYLLSVFIKADPAKNSFRGGLETTVRSIAACGADPADIQIVIGLPQPSSDAEEFCKILLEEAGTGGKIASWTEADLKGRFLTVIEPGDTFAAGKGEPLFKWLTADKDGVFLHPKEDFAPAAGDPVRIPADEAGDVELCPRGVFLPAEDVRERLVQLTAPDQNAAGEVLAAVLKRGGCYRFSDEPLSLIPEMTRDYDDRILPEVFRKLSEDSIAQSGKVAPFLQSVMVAAFQKSIEEHGDKDSVQQLVPYVDDKTIIEQKDLPFHYRLYLLEMKHGEPVLSSSVISEEEDIYYRDQFLCTLQSRWLKVDIMEVGKDSLTFSGKTEFHLFGEHYEMCVRSSKGGEWPLSMTPFKPLYKTGLDEEVFYRGRMFGATVPLEDGVSYRFFMKRDDGRDFQITPRFGNFAGLVNLAPFSYCVRNGWMVTYRKGSFAIQRATAGGHLKNELAYLKYLCRQKRYSIAGYRLLYHLDRMFTRKPIWIVGDRPHKAGDNGEHMFRYLQGTETAKTHTIYFLLKKDSVDYERIRKIGKVLEYGTLKHKLKFLQAETILCAAANDLATNAFGNTGTYYRDLYQFDFVYLRHGVSHNDQSSWLHKLNKNIRVLVATCRPEYEGILEGDYGYTEREVKLTGLPRFDNLYDERENKIAILPTWRNNIEGEHEHQSSQRKYVKNFKDTEYYLFYDRLIHHERLLAAMEQYGYTGCFYLHPAFEAQLKDFTSSSRIEVGSGVADYQKIFRESAIMVTDYSSVAFDFAYLKKPVIYAQFDEETFFRDHAWGKGYFTYREDGFGPITTTLEETVDELIKYMENGARMKEEYVQKVDRFFAYTDRNNCQRVYEAVLNETGIYDTINC